MSMKKVLEKLFTVAQQRDARAATRKTSRWQRGMSLVEVMVVLVIMGLVTSVIGVAVFNALGSAEVKTAKTQIANISDALDMYRLQHRRYPTTAEGLSALVQAKDGAAPVMDLLPKDPWGQDYVYIQPGQRNPGKFDLFSKGKDGAQGGGDDVGNWEDGTE